MPKFVNLGRCWESNPVSKLLLAPDYHQQSNQGSEQPNNQVTNQTSSQPGTKAALWQPVTARHWQKDVNAQQRPGAGS